MSTRRRTRAPTSGYDDFNERMYRPKDVSNNGESESGTSTNDHDDKDGGQRKTPKQQLMQHKAHQFVRRKREQFTFAKLRRRLANLRIIDVVLLLAFGAKLATAVSGGMENRFKKHEKWTAIHSEFWLMGYLKGTIKEPMTMTWDLGPGRH